MSAAFSLGDYSIPRALEAILGVFPEILVSSYLESDQWPCGMVYSKLVSKSNKH